MYVRMFIASLIIIVKSWTLDRKVGKLWHSLTLSVKENYPEVPLVT